MGGACVFQGLQGFMGLSTCSAALCPLRPPCPTASPSYSPPLPPLTPPPCPPPSLQMAALQAGLDGTTTVLIQGPPGTGKTRTILNLLSVIMHSAHKASLELQHRELQVRGVRRSRRAWNCSIGSCRSGEGESMTAGVLTVMWWSVLQCCRTLCYICYFITPYAIL